MLEIWKEIDGYDGYYQVSNKGNVRSLDRVVKDKFYPGMLLKQHIPFNHYPHININYMGKTKFYTVHRLVALAFIPNPNGFPCVNHKDENKTNNSVENLEWCTHKYNCNYGTKPLKSSLYHKGKFVSEETREKLRQRLIGRKLSEAVKNKMSESQKGVKKPPRSKEHIENLKNSIKTNLDNGAIPNASKKIINLNTGEIFNSCLEAQRHYGYKVTGGLSNHLKGETKTYKKCKWAYYNE